MLPGLQSLGLQLSSETGDVSGSTGASVVFNQRPEGVPMLPVLVGSGAALALIAYLALKRPVVRPSQRRVNRAKRKARN